MATRDVTFTLFEVPQVFHRISFHAQFHCHLEIQAEACGRLSAGRIGLGFIRLGVASLLNESESPSRPRKCLILSSRILIWRRHASDFFRNAFVAGLTDAAAFNNFSNPDFRKIARSIP